MSITSDSYAQYFGFTQREVDQMLEYYHITQNRETMKKWYDGYCFGEPEVYNPWSVVNYVESCLKRSDTFPKPYWSNTSSNSIVRKLVERANMAAKQDIELLIEGKRIQEETLYMEMEIPNSEVRYIYKTTVLRWFEEKVRKKDLSVFYRSILEGDVEIMEEMISENLMETISFYDYQESFYHGFLAGILKNIDNYIVLSNRESGNGRPDILLKYPSVRGKAVIYSDIIKCGIAFYRKECEVIKM